MSRTETRCITKKSKECHTSENKASNGRRWKISKTLEEKLVRNVSKDNSKQFRKVWKLNVEKCNH